MDKYFFHKSNKYIFYYHHIIQIMWFYFTLIVLNVPFDDDVPRL